MSAGSGTVNHHQDIDSRKTRPWFSNLPLTLCCNILAIFMRLLMQAEVIFQAVHDGGNSKPCPGPPAIHRRHQACQIFPPHSCLNAAAIQDGYGIGNILTVPAGHHRTYMFMHFLRLLAAGRFSGADGPNGFIGCDETLSTESLQVEKAFCQLLFHITVLCTRFPDRQWFTATKYRLDTRFKGPAKFFGEYGIGFMIIFPSFAVANDHIMHSHPFSISALTSPVNAPFLWKRSSGSRHQQAGPAGPISLHGQQVRNGTAKTVICLVP